MYEKGENAGKRDNVGLPWLSNILMIWQIAETRTQMKFIPKVFSSILVTLCIFEN